MAAIHAALAAILETFTEAEIVTLDLPYDAYASKLAPAISLGDGPDLFIDMHERLGDYPRRGIVAPVGDALEAEAFSDTTLSTVTVDDAIYGVPLGLKSVALYVNTDLVKEVPPTLEGIAALTATLPEGVYPLAHEAMNPYAHAPILHAFGGRMLTQDEQWGLVGPQAEASLRFVAGLIEAGAIPADADGALVKDLFRSGQAAFAISGPWLAGDLGELPYRVATLPVIEATGEPMRPYLTVEAVMLSPEGAKRPEVRALARHLASTEAARIRQAKARTLSARSDVAVGDDAFLQVFAEQAEESVALPSAPAMRSTWEPARHAVRKVLRG